MNIITTRRATATDTEALQRIGRQTFFETFAEANSEENMQTYLEQNFSTEKVSAELSNPDSAFYFAVLNNEVIGYLKVNYGPAQTELHDAQALEIERIYVLKQYHGLKVGQELYEIAVQIARAADARYIWLGVWEENKRAIAFYEKNGFVIFGEHQFKLGDEIQTDYMMKLEI